MIYEYKARELESGRQVKGKIETTSEERAAETLRGRGMVLTSLKSASGGIDLGEYLDRLQGISLKDKVVFTRQLSTMISSGLPLNEALNVLQQQTSNNKMKQLIGRISRDVSGGSSLSEALAGHSDVFSPVYINLVKAGEASGALEEVLQRLAEGLESSKEFRGRIIGAMIYPVIVIVGMVGVFVLMMTMIVPRLTEMYEDMGAELPLTTEIVIALSNFTVHYGWILGIGLVGVFFLIRRLLKVRDVRKKVDEFIFGIPIVGNLIKNTLLTEFTQTLSLLVSSGIPILDSLEIVADATNNLIYHDVIMDARKEVSYGSNLAGPFKASQHIPPIVGQMVAVGEETGKLDEVLLQLNRFFKNEADTALEALMSAMEPLIMILLGVMVGGLIFAVIVPIYGLTSQI